MTAIAADKLVVRRNGALLLDGLSLSLGSTGSVAVIGPNAEIPLFGSTHNSPLPKTRFGSSIKKLENVGGACSISRSVSETTLTESLSEPRSPQLARPPLGSRCFG